MRRKRYLVLALLHSLIASTVSPISPALSQEYATWESLTLTVFSDGFVLVDYKLLVNQSSPTINVTLLGQTFEDLIVVDEKGLPLDYFLINEEMVVYTLGANKTRITYFTQDLTSKIGGYWTLIVDVPTNATLELPIEAYVISLNVVPITIESSDSQITLIMPTGSIDVTYVISRQLSRPSLNYELLAMLAISVAIFGVILAYGFWRTKKRLKPPEEKQQIDVERIYKKHKDLRVEEKEAIQILVEKQGTAFEAELYAKLNLPRTTTWRMLKRLEKMGIIEIKKSRRQNIVSIKAKYRQKTGSTQRLKSR